MLRLTLNQMRQSAPRLIAAAIAIIISTAFAALTIIAGNAMTTATTAAFTARYAGADLVVQVDNDLTSEDLASMRAVPGVAAVDPMTYLIGEVAGNGRTNINPIHPAASDPRLTPLQMATGTMPTNPGEVALPTELAERLSAELGGTVQVTAFQVGDGDAVTMTVVGTTDDPTGAFAADGGALLISAAEMDTWLTLAGGRAPVSGANEAVIALTSDGVANQAQVRQDIQAALTASGGFTANQVHVSTTAELGANTAANATGINMMMVFVGVFASIALLVAGLIIANTFQVLVAQRTRDLALLRAVGAASSQVRNSVLVEALGLGLIGSTIGVLAGMGTGAAALRLLGGGDVGGGQQVDLFQMSGVPLPSTIQVTPAAILAPLLVGTLVTVLAALAPARAATSVSPLAAMRPMDAPSMDQAAGRMRLIVSLLGVAAGFALLFLSTRLAHDGEQLAVLVAVAGSIISFIGFVASAVFWLPGVIGWSGKLIARTGPTAKLAVANTLRNPRRTTATATALLIGTTLIAMMATGATTATATLNTVLDRQFPVDVAIQTMEWSMPEQSAEIPEAALAQLADVTGVAQVVPLPAATIGISAAGLGENPATPVRAATAADAAGVLRGLAQVSELSDDTVLISRTLFDGQTIAEGTPITLTGPNGEVTLSAVPVSPELGSFTFVTPSVLDSIAAEQTVTSAFMRLDRIADAPSVVPAVSDIISDSGVAANVLGMAAQRAQFQNIIDTLLNIIIGLLAAAVVIALIGVANTLSLSVIERRRESATLRAIGLSQGGLRQMLAIEGVVIAAVGAVIGIVFGLIYGWVGATSILAQTGDVVLGVPWVHILAALGIAILAGFLASILPGRAAAREKPVAALAAY